MVWTYCRRPFLNQVRVGSQRFPAKLTQRVEGDGEITVTLTFEQHNFVQFREVVTLFQNLRELTFVLGEENVAIGVTQNVRNVFSTG